MSKISYPAIFYEEDNSHWVEFPDLEGCFSSGETIEEAFENAKEAIGLYLDRDEDMYNRIINKPSSVKDVCLRNPSSIVMLVECDSLEYAKKYKTKAVKKTLSIPEWLNDLAIKENVNFSSVLQEALVKKLHIN